jgi:hypothetical protein
MPIIECHIVAQQSASAPPYIYVVYRHPANPVNTPATNPGRWQLTHLVPTAGAGYPTTLANWRTDPAGTMGRKIGPALYSYRLVPSGLGTDIRWVEPYALVELTIGDLPGSPSKETVIEGGRDGWGAVAAILKEVRTPAQSTSESLQDLIGFPLITSGADGSAGGSPAPAPGGQALVDAAIRHALGRKPSVDDVKGTLTLLDSRMELREEDGVSRWELRPTGALITQARNGTGVTGRQASVAGLAKDTIEAIAPIVERVERVVPATTNLHLLDAARGNFLAAARDAAAEAGVAGGPLAPKANVLLRQSLMQLGEFGVQLGVISRGGTAPNYTYQMTRTNIVTTQDEEQFTNFLVVLDRWSAFHDVFTTYITGARGPRATTVLQSTLPGTKDFGFVFTRLDRSVDVIAEAVDELDTAMASVGVDRAEREALHFKDNRGAEYTAADLMDWAHSFPEHEARPLIQEAGIEGIELLPARIRALNGLVRDLRDEARKNGSDSFKPLRHPRVQVALKKLHDELAAAGRAANQAQQANKP